MPGWSESEELFEERFGLSHGTFLAAVASLNDQLIERYESIRKADQEAAILWAIDMCRKHGILEED